MFLSNIKGMKRLTEQSLQEKQSILFQTQAYLRYSVINFVESTLSADDAEGGEKNKLSIFWVQNLIEQN
jgi:hypothetical protein